MKYSGIIHLIPNLEIWRCLRRAIWHRRSYHIKSRDNFAMRCLRRATPTRIFDNQKNSRNFELICDRSSSESLELFLKLSFTESF
ncbi:hypothetical protein [Nostoc sp. 'Peltigera membranacea cyanobiont' 210A]|uniref:hypothetical protein n=1 Tax=Nostoc sp. 'Peltigera membranacea cyanobiont' 210A TaxID=2014529 RepID=UPI00117D360E|nr:hypothetical protein [Nostoc sp. 'Peltigera membranacea cyanobiont' 210A]